jgi:hypothetical protein
MERTADAKVLLMAVELRELPRRITTGIEEKLWSG